MVVRSLCYPAGQGVLTALGGSGVGGGGGGSGGRMLFTISLFRLRFHACFAAASFASVAAGHHYVELPSLSRPGSISIPQLVAPVSQQFGDATAASCTALWEWVEESNVGRAAVASLPALPDAAVLDELYRLSERPHCNSSISRFFGHALVSGGGTSGSTSAAQSGQSGTLLVHMSHAGVLPGSL